ncbi:MAG: hypothetical protein JO161_10205 [Planctomycetaceae bacterium]|nr:hypothetical protein [Planctomycetaceae bacterium]
MYEEPTLARWRFLTPGPHDLVFAVVLLLILLGGRHALFNDPGTLWHLRLGRDIVASGTVPRCDTLTYTHAQSPWIDQSWAYDTLLALIVDHAGWSTAFVLTVIALALVYAAQTQGLISDGITPIVAVFISLLAVAIGCLHFLIRPHVVTLAFVYLALRFCQSQHQHGGWTVAWVIPLSAILANIHGGFIALPAIVATAAVGHAISGPWNQERARNLAKFGLVFVGSCLGALLNPYGWDLYRHVGNLLLSSGVTSLIEEYQPAPFGKPQARVLEIVLLSLVGLPAVVNRRVDRYHLAHLLVWLHLALTSIRNAPLFALAAAPALAQLIDGLPLSFRHVWSKFPERSAYIPAIATGLILLAVAGVNLGTFDRQRWPFSALETLNRQPFSARLFHEQDWGGLIAAETRPIRRSYLDDRFELYGKDVILEYVDALSGGPVWDKVRNRDKIDLVWVRPDRGLAQRMAAETQWKELYRDSVSVLFGRKGIEAHADAQAPNLAAK